MFKIGLNLSEHNFVVNINNNLLSKFSVISGVPQGSIHGPILFILCTKHLFVLKYNVSIEIYADDTQLFAGFKTDWIDNFFNNMNECLNEIKMWLNY